MPMGGGDGNYVYLISILSVFILWGIGNKWRWIWWVGIANQFLWLYYVFDRSEYGLLPMNLAYTAVYIRNLIKWRNVKTATQTTS